MSDVIESTFELPTFEQVASVLAMCEKHDLPLSSLPDLWDKYTQLEKVERRIGIQNGNMERELMRLRQYSHELDKQLTSQVADNEVKRLRIHDLEEAEKRQVARLCELEKLALECAPLLRQITELEDQRDHQQALIEHQQEVFDELGEKYEALRIRCKHFEEQADPRKVEDLEDLVQHYRSGMEGMKALADNKHFSHEWRLWLIRRTLNAFEPTTKAQPDA